MPNRGRPRNPIRAEGQLGRLPGQKAKKKGLNLRRQIYTLNKAMEGHKSIKVSAMDLLNDIAIGIMKTLAREAADLCVHG